MLSVSQSSDTSRLLSSSTSSYTFNPSTLNLNDEKLNPEDEVKRLVSTAKILAAATLQATRAQKKIVHHMRMNSICQHAFVNMSWSHVVKFFHAMAVTNMHELKGCFTRKSLFLIHGCECRAITQSKHGHPNCCEIAG
jgi:hypothetical protein